jgi:hypothetical protein
VRAHQLVHNGFQVRQDLHLRQRICLGRMHALLSSGGVSAG